jgi:hypothetical protein
VSNLWAGRRTSCVVERYAHLRTPPHRPQSSRSHGRPEDPFREKVCASGSHSDETHTPGVGLSEPNRKSTTSEYYLASRKSRRRHSVKHIFPEKAQRKNTQVQVK